MVANTSIIPASPTSLSHPAASDLPPVDSSLPWDLRRELAAIQEVLPHLSAAHSTRRLHSACKALAPSLKITHGSLYRRVSKYLKSGNPMDLVDKRECASLWKTKEETVRLPLAFRRWVQTILEKHSRCDASGLREIIAIWATHHDSRGRRYDAIPGYATWPQAYESTQRPYGWSDRNLYRCAPDAFDAAAARNGLSDAAQFRPPVLTTRVGLLIGQRVEFDDHEYNVKILFPGQPRVSRPLGFGCVDVASGWLFPCFRPTLWDALEEKRKKLTEREFRWFVTAWLTTCGYRADTGTVFVTEKGTAVIRDDFAARIHRATRGKVTISAGTMFKDSAHPGQFAPRARGNFHHKGLLESSWNLVDNYFDALPGQTGNSRHEPAELHGRTKYTEQLLDKLALIEPSRAALAQLPVMTWGEFSQAAFGIYDTINAAVNHHLEGWKQLGHEVVEYLVEGLPPIPAHKFAALEPGKQAALEAIATTRARQLSRAEVWNRGRNDLTRVHAEHYCELMGIEEGIEVKVGSHHPGLITIADSELTDRPVHFLAQGRNGTQFRNGDKFLAFFCPITPHVLQLCTADGVHITLVDRWTVPSKADAHGIERQMGKQNSWLTTRTQAMTARHTDDAIAQADLRAHNAALLAGNILSQEEQAEVRATEARLQAEPDDFRSFTGTPENHNTDPLTMDDLNELAP